MKKTLLLDGDELIFKATAAIEQEVDWGDGNHVLWSNPENAWSNFEGIVKRLLDRFEVKAKDAIMCFSGTYGDTPNFRLAIAPSYKGHRGRKPMCYWEVRLRAEAAYNTVVKPGLEADDVMGILATKPDRKTQAIICSQDKDMQTLPTTVWDGQDLFTHTEAEADAFHMYQTLTGDTADGYPGCPGVGEVTAKTFLASPYILTPFQYALTRGKRKGEAERRYQEVATDNVWAGVVSFYEKAGLTEDDALKQARLARILRWTDWDHEKKQPILWKPNT